MTGNEIKKLRKRLKWSQRKLGEFIGVEQPTVCRMETGKSKPSGPVLRLLTSLKRDPAPTGVPFQ